MAAVGRCFTFPVHGETGEDRWAWARAPQGASCYVLCDGASESFDGATWAGTLAQVLARGLLMAGAEIKKDAQREHQHFINLIKEAQKIYAQQSQMLVPGELEWLNRQALARGSWSTVLALRFSPHNSYADLWALGDTMLFLRDGDRVVASFPLLEAKATPDNPLLVPSRGTVPSEWCRRRLNLRALHKPRLLLTTDALGYYMLARPESERLLLWDFWSRAPKEALDSWLMNEQRRGALPSDDCTFLELLP
ncbi:hypothetical protein [Gracilinema caldarium]|uniref:Protein phosphatase 2C-like protein n=1 Tax=Gracilinema caldarium (strain ATCC 51460 / DSM 7334 / H1) TaxID=744872 RepID=F8EYC2_GRAC1|nr:hypothetical protein [Gracilinema caldarium]AEJ18281.1 hypothetical protein Spica_0112 [Gracilinema caldarium DSM 7334]